ncbi:MAG: hypothetical protein ACRC8Y_12105 [Chroococcales cyanobacterium]
MRAVPYGDYKRYIDNSLFIQVASSPLLSLIGAWQLKPPTE